eukprot:3672862-Amphidinium_carterae.1
MGESWWSIIATSVPCVRGQQCACVGLVKRDWTYISGKSEVVQPFVWSHKIEKPDVGVKKTCGLSLVCGRVTHNSVPRTSSLPASAMMHMVLRALLLQTEPFRFHSKKSPLHHPARTPAPFASVLRPCLDKSESRLLRLPFPGEKAFMDGMSSDVLFSATPSAVIGALVGQPQTDLRALGLWGLC